MTSGRTAGALIALASVVTTAFVVPDRRDAFERGSIRIEAPGALELGPDGVLFIADSRAATIYAIEVGKASVGAAGKPLTVDDLGGRIAALLGVRAEDVQVKDMVTQPQTGTTYLSVVRGRTADATGAIVTVSPDGTVALLDLTDVKFAKHEIESAPGATQGYQHPAWKNSMRRTHTITDIGYSDGELYVTGVTNEEFASSLRRVPYPFRGAEGVTKVGVYHTEHGEYETEAPIMAFLPVRLKDQATLLVGYACTPIAKFPLSAARAGATVRGSTVIELGSGTSPRDMLTFSRGGVEQLLIATGRGVYRATLGDLADARNLTVPTDGQDGVKASLGLSAVREIEKVGDGNYLVLEIKANNALSLRTITASEF